MATARPLQWLILASCCLIATVSANCCRMPIPPVPCPCKPTCGGPPCINYDCCPGADRGKGGGCGCGRKKRSADPTETTKQLREVATIDFGSFMDKVSVPVQDLNCNSERLRAVLEQSISENTTQSVERILDRIDDGQFIAKCTFNGKPEMERRVSFCQLTKGNTTCALATGLILEPTRHEVKLNVSEFFKPEMQSIVVDGPTPPPLFTVALPEVIPTLVPSVGPGSGFSRPIPPAPINKRRGEGFVKH